MKLAEIILFLSFLDGKGAAMELRKKISSMFRSPELTKLTNYRDSRTSSIGRLFFSVKGWESRSFE